MLVVIDCKVFLRQSSVVDQRPLNLFWYANILIKNVHLTSYSTIIMPQGHQRYESQGVSQIFFEKVVGGQPKAFIIIYAHQWLTLTWSGRHLTSHSMTYAIIIPQGHQRQESQGDSSPVTLNQVQKQGIYFEQVNLKYIKLQNY